MDNQDISLLIVQETKEKKKKTSLLEVDEETKEKFLSILNKEESDSDSSSEEKTEDEEFLNVAQDSEDSGQECNCRGAFCPCDSQSIIVLSKDSAEILFATIEDIKDDDARRSYFWSFKSLSLNKRRKKLQ